MRSLSSVNLNECDNCGEYKLPHHICSSCGHYNKNEIVPINEELDLEDETA